MVIKNLFGLSLEEMSFDLEFDYAPIKEHLNGFITEYQSDIGNVQSELAMLGNLAPEFLSLAESRVTYLETRLDCRNMSISRLGNVISEVEDVENLDLTSKDTLYTFYANCLYPNRLEPKGEWMRRMVYNHREGLVQDCANLIACVEANVVSVDEEICVSGLICRKYPKRRATGSFTGHFGFIENYPPLAGNISGNIEGNI